jgi:hypothetical protein
LTFSIDRHPRLLIDYLTEMSTSQDYGSLDGSAGNLVQRFVQSAGQQEIDRLHTSPASSRRPIGHSLGQRLDRASSLDMVEPGGVLDHDTEWAGGDCRWPVMAAARSGFTSR